MNLLHGEKAVSGISFKKLNKENAWSAEFGYLATSASAGTIGNLIATGRECVSAHRRRA
jgi:hypothetical protein